jgi:hypothetical protein
VLLLLCCCLLRRCCCCPRCWVGWGPGQIARMLCR